MEVYFKNSPVPYFWETFDIYVGYKIKPARQDLRQELFLSC